MWDFMAKRELDAAGAPELQSAKGRASDTDRREDRCCAVYEEALKSLNTGIMMLHLPPDTCSVFSSKNIKLEIIGS